MPFPQGQREIFRKNTITEAVCQLRFPTILEASAHSPVQYQNLVKSEYPFYSEEKPQVILPKEVQELAGGFPLAAGLHQTSLHNFYNPENSCRITLNQDFLAVSETKYDRWQYLRDRICRAEEAFRGIYHPLFYTRVGLRYKNLINRDELGLVQQGWHHLLNPSLVGLLGIGEISEQVVETRGQSLIKLLEVPNAYVRIVHGVPGHDRSSYQIEADFFIDERKDAKQALAVLDEFNRVAAGLYSWATSRVLRDTLGPVTADG
jgi:uncharacterized protein (TIGR04255 family)